MPFRWKHLRHVLVDGDRAAVPALVWRVLFSLLFFSPWAFRFVPSAFRMEDVEPFVLQEALTRGINLLDPASWPTASGVAFKLFLLPVAMGVGWWLFNRLRRYVAFRIGPGILPIAVTIGGVLMVRYVTFVVMKWDLIRASTQDMGVVWNGWVYHPCIDHEVLLTRVALLVLLGPMLLELVIQGLEARQQLEEARDGALRARIAPHFLFNTLNILHAQIEEDVEGAQLTTVHLARLFRQVLEVSEQPTVPLKQELAFVEDYLSIERARFGERLRVQIEVSEEAAEARIPVLGLQTLVENAIRHGVEPRPHGGLLAIRAWMEGRHVQVAVEDPGNGRPGKPGTGRALANLRARLARPKDLVMTPTGQGFQVSFRFFQV